MKTPAAQVAIRPIHWTEIPAFIRLRDEVERTASHLPVTPGERNETPLHMWGKMFLLRKRNNILLAVDHGRIVGYLTLLFPKFKKFRTNSYITLGVKPGEQGKGIGTLLISKAEEIAKKRNCRRMELEVFGKNVKAIELYERLGYVIEGRRKNAVEDASGLDDIVFMAKALN